MEQNIDDQTMLLTIMQTTKMLGLSVPTIYRLINNGDLRSIRVGRARRIPRRALDAWLEREMERGMENGAEA